jgi:hypothetical protein
MHSGSTPAMTDAGSVVGVADWAATSYVESGLEAAGEIITKFKLHKHCLSSMFQTFILLTTNNEVPVV